jgi:hypothetical protein
MQTDPKPTLRRVMMLGSSLTAGFATASLQALQPSFSFQISFKTLVAFGLGFVALLAYWRIFFSSSDSPGQKRLRVIASILLALAGVAGFLYPLRFIAPNNHAEVAAGLGLAFCALAGVTVLLFWCKRFLDEDTRNNGPY